MDTNQDREREPTGTLEQMRRELRQSIESTVEKSMMENQFNKSKVEFGAVPSFEFLSPS